MDSMGLPRDAITYSSVISALAKGKQWAHALQAGPPSGVHMPFKVSHVHGDLQGRHTRL